MKFNKVIDESKALEKKIVKHMQKYGESKGKSTEGINPKELVKGIKMEKEHTPSKPIAKEIAKDHLRELPKYYTRLKKMEKKAKAENAKKKKKK